MLSVILSAKQSIFIISHLLLQINSNTAVLSNYGFKRLNIGDRRVLQVAFYIENSSAVSGISLINAIYYHRILPVYKTYIMCINHMVHAHNVCFIHGRHEETLEGVQIRQRVLYFY